ncbi:MAG: sulfotransferase domain-containing protein [Phycisphaerales bacterium]|nr:sulfotransferase domain-containing protein [Phycisphaerales bacterium]
MNINPLLERVSTEITRSISIRYASSIPHYPLVEYPKCGGTWVCRMLAESLALPFAQYSRLPVAMPSVIHNHWKFHPKFENCTYLMRDGRDVMVSFYFHFTRKVGNPNQKNVDIYIDKLRKILGENADFQDVQANLPAFIEHLFAKPVGCRQNWRDHNLAWMNQPKVHYLKYEDLRHDCVAAVTKHVSSLASDRLNEDQIERAVDHFSMKRMTGRNPGEEDKGSFIRKGVVGDWKNHFTREAAEVFDGLAGDVLVQLGYETDNSWVGRCDPAQNAE